MQKLRDTIFMNLDLLLNILKYIRIELIFYVLQWDVQRVYVGFMWNKRENFMLRMILSHKFYWFIRRILRNEEFSEFFLWINKTLIFYIDMHTLKQAPEQQHDTRKIYLKL